MALAGRRWVLPILFTAAVLVLLRPLRQRQPQQHGTTSRWAIASSHGDRNDEGQKEGPGARGREKAAADDDADTTTGRRRLLDERQFPRLEFDFDDGKPFAEPPPLTNPVPDVWVQRCSRFNATGLFARGANCGLPLSEPCFDRGRCQAEGGPKVYVYDKEVGGWVGGWVSGRM